MDSALPAASLLSVTRDFLQRAIRQCYLFLLDVSSSLHGTSLEPDYIPNLHGRIIQHVAEFDSSYHNIIGYFPPLLGFISLLMIPLVAILATGLRISCASIAQWTGL